MIRATSVFIRGNTGAVMANIASKIGAAAERAAEIVKQEAQAIVPVDTGDLLLSIGLTESIDNGKSVTVGVIATAPYSAFIEFGTVKMSAQPFLRPAIDQAHKRILEEFGR
jgi:HK97 gp10 family phage protein